jgi:hypothetical protein
MIRNPMKMIIMMMTYTSNRRRFGREQFGEIASPYLTPDVYNKRFLDKQYGLRKERGNFKIGDSVVTVDIDSDVYIKGPRFKGTEGL